MEETGEVGGGYSTVLVADCYDVLCGGYSDLEVGCGDYFESAGVEVEAGVGGVERY